MDDFLIWDISRFTLYSAVIAAEKVKFFQKCKYKINTFIILYYKVFKMNGMSHLSEQRRKVGLNMDKNKTNR